MNRAVNDKGEILGLAVAVIVAAIISSLLVKGNR
jgi:hypothetical protein